MIHALKCWPEYFQAVFTGEKPYELRKADRDFKAGDMLHLMEWNPETKTYTMRSCERRVTHILTGPVFGLEDGWCILGLGRKGSAAPRRKDHR